MILRRSAALAAGGDVATRTAMSTYLRVHVRAYVCARARVLRAFRLQIKVSFRLAQVRVCARTCMLVCVNVCVCPACAMCEELRPLRARAQ
jgi:hypothetical protein